MVLVKVEQPKAVLRRTALKAVDFAALAHVRQACALDSDSEALRWSVEQQARRDGVYPPGGPSPDELPGELFGRFGRAGYDRLCAAVRASVLVPPGGVPQTVAGDDSPLRQWSFWSYPHTDDWIGKTADLWSLGGRAQAIRFCVRVHARLCGFQPAAGLWS